MLIILDWDGTLIDSTDRIADCLVEAGYALEQFHVDHKQAKRVIGLGLDEAIMQLFPDLAPEQVQECREHYVRLFLEHEQTPSELFPQVLETLNELREQGHFLAIATGKSRKGLNRVLDAMQLHYLFDATRCADETRSKPDPCMLYELMDEFQYEPHQCLMVGDTVFDMQMAQTVAMPAVAVDYGVHSEEELLACEPIAMIDDFSQLLNVIEDIRMVADIDLNDDE